MLNYEKQSPIYIRSDYPDRQGMSSFFRKVREKISTLKLLTVCTTAAAVSRFCGGSAPAPPTSPKEQKGMLRNKA